MNAIWKTHAGRLVEFLNNNNEAQAHLYLEQLMLFPAEVQDKIIEDISLLNQCTSEEIASIISKYTIFEDL